MPHRTPLDSERSHAVGFTTAPPLPRSPAPSASRPPSRFGSRASPPKATLTPPRHTASRVTALVLLAIVVLAITGSAALHETLLGLFEAAGALLQTHAVAGPVVFVLLAAGSAMLAFFSSAALVPAGVVTWGLAGTAGLLALGWLVGGAASYAVARWLGAPLLRRVNRSDTLTRYQHRIARGTPFPVIVLFQLALPSEIPGYVLGLVRYPFLKYLAALALVELPFAIVTVWMGQEFLRRELLPLLTALVVGVLVGTVAIRLLQQRLDGGGAA